MEISKELNPYLTMFSFKDVIITNQNPSSALSPALYKGNSRKEIEIFETFHFSPEHDITVVPFIPAPMTGMLNYVNYIKFARNLFTTLDPHIIITIPRFPSEIMKPEVRYSFVKAYHRLYDKLVVVTAVGINQKEELELVDELFAFYKHNPQYFGIILFDVSNGYHEKLVNLIKNTVKRIESERLKNLFIMYGNFMGEPPYKHRLLLYRFGVGGGRVCSTRLKSSTGGPSIWASLRSSVKPENIMESKGYSFHVSADNMWSKVIDGGISQPSYVPIALLFGIPMIGSLFLHTEMNISSVEGTTLAGYQGVVPYIDFKESYEHFIEHLKISVSYLLNFLSERKSIDEITEIDGLPRKSSKKLIVGSSLFSSKGGLSEFPEGVVKVVYQKPLFHVLQDIRHSITTAFSLVGASELIEFRNNAYLIKVSDGEWHDRNYVDAE